MAESPDWKGVILFDGMGDDYEKRLLELNAGADSWNIFGSFEVSKFDLRGQTLVCKVQCFRSSRFGIFKFLPSLAFIMHQFFIGKLISIFTQPLFQSCIFITRSIKSCTFIEHYSLISMVF